jgi:hypothetical protein
LIAININQKRLMDVDDYIDDPNLENLVTDEEWNYIKTEKFQNPEEELKELHKLEWYQLI